MKKKTEILKKVPKVKQRKLGVLREKGGSMQIMPDFKFTDKELSEMDLT
jgi:hypothetical protein